MAQTAPSDNERLLLMPEVSERTRMPVDTLRYLRQIGSGPPSFRLGRRVVYRESALLHWMREQEAADREDRAGDVA